MSNAQAEFIKISNGYNAFCKGKYQRQLWRDFSLQEIAHYPALREAVLNWALKEYQLSTARVCEIKSWLKACYGEHLKPSRELQVLEKDLVVIANALSSEQLVVIPNGKIYVINNG